VSEPLCVLVIIAHEIGGIALGGRGARTHVKNEIEIPESSGVEAVEKDSGVDVIRECEWLEIAPLLVRTEKIGDDDILDAASVQLTYEVASNKTGATCYKDSATL
jgi:hypothetical protein